MPMFRNNLKLKVSLYLAMALSVVMFGFVAVLAREHATELEKEIARHVTQISDLIVKSTRHAMLLNKRDLADKIISDIGKQKGIERVRIISKDGTIIHSNRDAEVGYSVEQNAPPCVYCHLSSKPIDRLPDEDRWKIYNSADGHRVLGTMQVIRNEPTCANASCHEHPASQTILGVVDVSYSLEEVDASKHIHLNYLIGLSVAFILLVAFSVGFLLKKLIYAPLKDLESGAKRISSGNLGDLIPVRSDDEFGRVAGTFNEMNAALDQSHRAMQELVENLESKVEARTRELLAARAEVAQGEKLASIGVLSAGIAHELNNPLTGVLTFTSLMRKKVKDGTEDAEDLDLVIRETKRCAAIIRRLLDFAREKVPVNGFFNLNQVVEDTVRFVERPASLHQIEISTHLDATLPQVWGDADLIKQVMMNLLVNAQQAVDKEGRISVETRLITPSDTHEQQTVEISVRDNGCGIPQANLQRIFDPFFTSKEVGKGTGLGLSVSYGIVKAHGGKISVESTVGEGTVFHVQLPVVSPFIDSKSTNRESKT
ncbi:MAG: HAMP domain-containing protein [Rhodoferax sp.]|nr:HAMP domain-containing protein [Rhodoferax sp.]